MSSILGFDVPCRCCGYNLRGLTLGSVCPECRGPTPLSLRGDRLVYSRPEYVRKMARGAQWIAAGVALYIASSLIGGIIVGALIGRSSPTVSAWLGISFWLVPLASVGLIVAGWWAFTAPDPAWVRHGRGIQSRLWARWSLAAVVLSSLGVIATLWVSASSASPSPGGAIFLIFPFFLFISVLALLHYYAGLIYTRGIVRRAPPGRLLGVTTWLLWAPLIQFGASLVGSLCVPIAALSGLFMIACTVLYVVLYGRLSMRLRAASRQAEELWSGALDPARLVEGEAPLPERPGSLAPGPDASRSMLPSDG